MAKTKASVAKAAEAPKTEKATPKATPKAAPQAAPAAAPDTLTISDIQALAECVDLACRRGAFQAAEMVSVGTVYNKVSGFLQMVAAQKKEQEAEQAGE